MVRHFVQQAAGEGIDLFRVFDSLNWVENMRVAIDAVLETGALCEGAICYTGDLFDADRPKYGLAYYVKLAKELERAGCHILGDQGHGGRLPAARGGSAGEGVARGDRPAGSFPYPRHQRRRGGERAGRSRMPAWTRSTLRSIP